MLAFLKMLGPSGNPTSKPEGLKAVYTINTGVKKLSK